jgi:hypothetical protein
MNGLIERHDWKIWTALSVFYAAYCAADILLGGQTYAGLEAVLFTGVTGMTWEQLQAADPAAARLVDSLVRSSGAQMLVSGLLSLAISIFGLRQGQRWAWWTMWLWPFWLLSVILIGLLTEKVPGAGVPLPMIAAIIALVITVPTLALTYRKFNPTP